MATIGQTYIANKNEELAIKMISKKLLNKSKTYMNLLEDELSILLEVQHHKIMNVIDIVEDHLYYSIITEYIGGGPLITRLLLTGALKEE